MNQKLTINPWLTIWLQPRKTIRALINYNLNHHFLTLCTLYGFSGLLLASQMPFASSPLSLAFTVIIVVIFSMPIGYILFNLLSVFLFLTGKMIKGKGRFKEIRAALVWASVPYIVASLLLASLIVICVGELCMGYTRGAITLTYGFLVLMMQIVLSVWTLIIFFQALGEVQKFSARKAIGNALLAIVGGGAVVALIYLGVIFMLSFSVSP